MAMVDVALNISALSTAINEFSFSLYGELSKNYGNIFYSPLSIQLVLFFASIGAKDYTYEQILNVTRLPDNQPNVLSIYKRYLSKYKDITDLKMTTGIFIERSSKVNQSYVTTAKEFLNSTVEGLDFHDNSKREKNYLNEWVSNYTDGKISNIFQDGIINEDTRLVLANAIHFQSMWETKFQYVVNGQFFINSTDKILVSMMWDNKKLYHYKSDSMKYSAVLIPYKDTKFNMLILLPETVDGLADLESNLIKIQLHELLKRKMSHRMVKLGLPKFHIDQLLDMKPILSHMGCDAMFTSYANFSGMASLDSGTLFVSSFLHKTHLDVTNEGTEAIGVTKAIVSLERSASPHEHRIPKVSFVADHPFIFAIMHQTDVVFLGRLNNLPKTIKLTL